MKYELQILHDANEQYLWGFTPAYIIFVTSFPETRLTFLNDLLTDSLVGNARCLRRSTLFSRKQFDFNRHVGYPRGFITILARIH